MTRIQQRRNRHFMDEEGRLFWINGPEDDCYLSEQRQWRQGLCFEDVLEWKQCAPTGCVSQRFPSPTAAREAFEHAQVVWSHDVYLRRMGDEMARLRGLDDYKPTAMRLAEARGARPRQAPWILSGASGPTCAPPPSQARDDLPHPRRRRRGAVALSVTG
jgi:hypothetical protein